MKKYQYKCRLLSDVIITSMAATEGYKASLDYIPGSKFLGIVAGKLYDEQNEKATLDLFHNGNVSFGDATILLNGEATHKVPFSWFLKKGENLSDGVYLHHLLDDNDHTAFRNGNVQLKQVREGYFSAITKEFISIDQEFSLKSAQDTDNRRSKDGQMFGYFSLQSGTEWTFCVEDKEGIYAADIKAALEGKHRIGRSRSAEYGLVEISFIEKCKEQAVISLNGEVVIYAQSNLCFYNKFGQTTALPIASQLVDDENATINWAKSQVRSRNYKTWNRHRNNKDADRIIIERGSVFVVNLPGEVSSIFTSAGIGSYQNEGFGNVLVNPAFLLSDTKKLSLKLMKKLEYQQQFAVDTGINDNEILAALSARRKRHDFDYLIDKMVNEFKENHGSKFGDISKSQWGTLRNYGKNNEDIKVFEEMVFLENFGILYKGQSENAWSANNCRIILKDYLDNFKVNILNNKPDNTRFYLPFVVKLCSLMAKN